MLFRSSLFAQKMARLLLNMGQFQGELSGAFFYRALKAQVWDIVSYSSERFGWTKLFRVWQHQITGNNGIGMLLREVNARGRLPRRAATSVTPSPTESAPAKGQTDWA